MAHEHPEWPDSPPTDPLIPDELVRESRKDARIAYLEGRLRRAEERLSKVQRRREKAKESLKAYEEILAEVSTQHRAAIEEIERLRTRPTTHGMSLEDSVAELQARVMEQARWLVEIDRIVKGPLWREGQVSRWENP